MDVYFFLTELLLINRLNIWKNVQRNGHKLWCVIVYTGEKEIQEYWLVEDGMYFHFSVIGEPFDLGRFAFSSLNEKGIALETSSLFFFFLIFNSFITSTTYWKISYMFSDIAPPFVFNQTSWKFSHCSMWFIFYYVCKKCYFRKMFWVLLLFLDFLCLFFL